MEISELKGKSTEIHLLLGSIPYLRYKNPFRMVWYVHAIKVNFANEIMK